MSRFPREVREADQRIRELSRTLRYAVDGLAQPELLALAFGMRGWDFYRGVKHAITGPSQYGPQVELRALLEVAIVCRWLEDDPPVRTELWMADDRRSQLRGMKLGAAFAEQRGSTPPRPYTDQEREEMEQGIEAARQRAREAGTPDVPKSGRVLPTIEAMTRSSDDLRETTVLYWTLSPFAHAGGRSFTGDDVEQREDGKLYLVSEAPMREPASILAMAESILLHLWASASRVVGLGIEEECDQLRLSVVYPTRLGTR